MSHHHAHDHSDHGHDHHDDNHGHDHSDEIEPALQTLIWQQIEFEKICTLNESEPDAGAKIVEKTWPQRLNPEPELASDSDEQLLMFVPYVIRTLQPPCLLSVSIEFTMKFPLPPQVRRCPETTFASRPFLRLPCRAQNPPPLPQQRRHGLFVRRGHPSHANPDLVPNLGCPGDSRQARALREHVQPDAIRGG